MKGSCGRRNECQGSGWGPSSNFLRQGERLETRDEITSPQPVLKWSVCSLIASPDLSRTQEALSSCPSWYCRCTSSPATGPSTNHSSASLSPPLVQGPSCSQAATSDNRRPTTDLCAHEIISSSLSPLSFKTPLPLTLCSRVW